MTGVAMLRWEDAALARPTQKMGLLWVMQLVKVTSDKSPWLKVQSPDG